MDLLMKYCAFKEEIECKFKLINKYLSTTGRRVKYTYIQYQRVYNATDLASGSTEEYSLLKTYSNLGGSNVTVIP